MRHYEPPDTLAGTVFDPADETFGPIMAALQAGEFETAATLTARLANTTTIYLVVKPENILSPSVYAFANETDRDAFFATIGPSDNAYTDDVEILTSAEAS